MNPYRVLTQLLPLAGMLALAPIALRHLGPADGPRHRPEPLAVAVIDMVRVVEQYPKYIELRQQLAARQQEYELQLREADRQLDELRATIQMLVDALRERGETESTEIEDAQHDYDMRSRNRDYLRKRLGERLRTDELRRTIEIYQDVELAVAKVAAERGVAVVLASRELPALPKPIEELSSRAVQQRVLACDQRQVWYAAPELDLTGEVIKFLMTPLPDRKAQPDRKPG